MFQVGTRSIASAWQEDTIKHQRLSTKITHMDLTWLGCALALVDSHGQLYVVKVPPILEPGMSRIWKFKKLLILTSY